MTRETLIVALPVYDKVHHGSWKAGMPMAAHLGRIFPKGYLAFADVHRLPQPHAQNLLIRRCLGMKMPATGRVADWILWIEDDTLPPQDSFEQLRGKADKDTAPVVHGLSVAREYPHWPSAWLFDRDSDGEVVALRAFRDWEPDILYRVDHSGTCLTLFHTSVFARLKEPWFRMRPFLQGEHKGAQCCLSLSARMHGAGIPIYVYTGCLVDHLVDPLPVGPQAARQLYTDDMPVPVCPLEAYAAELLQEFRQ